MSGDRSREELISKLISSNIELKDIFEIMSDEQLEMLNKRKPLPELEAIDIDDIIGVRGLEQAQQHKPIEQCPSKSGSSKHSEMSDEDLEDQKRLDRMLRISKVNNHAGIALGMLQNTGEDINSQSADYMVEHISNNALQSENEESIKSDYGSQEILREVKEVENIFPSGDEDHIDSEIEIPDQDLQDINIPTFLSEVDPLMPITSSLHRKKIEKIDLEILNKVDEDGDESNILRFFLLDIIESSTYEKEAPSLKLFGKVKKARSEEFVSCCAEIKDVKRREYFILKKGASFLDTKSEIEGLINHSESVRIVDKPVNKKYCFNKKIPVSKEGVVECVEVIYSGSRKNLIRKNGSGKFFEARFGESFSPLQLLVLEGKIYGACWIDIAEFEIKPRVALSSRCSCEIVIESIFDIEVSENGTTLPAPQLKILFLDIESGQTQKQINTISMATADIKIESLGSNPPLNCHILTTKSLAALAEIKSRLEAKEGLLTEYSDSATMLQSFIQKVAIFDPDFIIGHKITSVGLLQLFTDISDSGIKDIDRLSRIKDDKINIKRLINNFPLKFIINLFTRGRLVVDIVELSDRLRSEVDYSIPALSRKYLNKPFIYDEQSSKIMLERSLRRVLIIVQLCAKFEFLGFTKELSNVTGCLWKQALSNGKAVMNDMLLMHTFFENGYLLPDYNTTNDNEDSDKEGPGYQGGYVINPKPGIYKDVVLLLDFNSLYPSIIQEYNVCFTTVPQISSNDSTCGDFIDVDNLAKEYELVRRRTSQKADSSILPSIVRKLVLLRNSVKDQMKAISDVQEKAKLDLKQRTFKIVANSIYGCLGSQTSRFYSKPLAALITYYGRSLLRGVASKIAKTTKFEVIYGDTDSVVISTKTTDLKPAIQIGLDLVNEINKEYSNGVIEIGIDNVFTKLFLRQKKKYAGLSVVNFIEVLKDNAEPIFTTEVKGLEFRNPSIAPVCRRIGEKLLSSILSMSEISSSQIYELLSNECKQLTELGESSSLADFTMHQKISRSLADYPKKQPPIFLKPALRMMKSLNYEPNQMKSMTVPYIICIDQEEQFLSNRAYLPLEIEESSSSEKPLRVDIEYYLSNQLAGTISQLIKSIPDISFEKISEVTGIPKSKFSKYIKVPVIAAQVIQKTKASVLFIGLRNQKKLIWMCNSCSSQNYLEPNTKLRCKTCNEEISTQKLATTVRNALQWLISEYYSDKHLCVSCEAESYGEEGHECSFCGDIVAKKMNERNLCANLEEFELALSNTEGKNGEAINVALKEKMVELCNTVKEIRSKSKYELISFDRVFQVARKAGRSGVAERFKHYRIIQVKEGN